MNLLTPVALSLSPFAPYNTPHALSLSTHYLCPSHPLMTHIGRPIKIIPELPLFQLLTNLWLPHALVMPPNDNKMILLFKEDSMKIAFVRIKKK